MKRFVVLFLVASVLATAAFADPIGLTAKIDGFSFGNVAADDYEFAGAKGKASVTPGLDFSKTFGAFKLGAGLQDKITLSDPLAQVVRLHVKGTYALQLAEGSKLSLSLYDKFYLEGGYATASKAVVDKFADTKLGQVYDRVAPGIRFDQTLDFGTIYAIAEVDFNINFAEGTEVAISSGDDDGFKVGVTTNVGFSGYVQPVLVFTNALGTDVDDVLTGINVRAIYGITSSLEARVTFAIPTVEKGFETTGLGIQPRVTYSNIVPGLGAYADFNITAIGADGDIGFTPTIGVTYAF
jgi:hypothetical protein